MTPPLLDVRHLSASYSTPFGLVRAVRDISFQISAGETLALVGETGCGKSTVALSLLGLLETPRSIVSGKILFEGQDLLRLGTQGWRQIRGRKIGMVFQDPRSSLNPVLTVEDHLLESLQAHQDLSKGQARHQAIAILKEVGFSDPTLNMRQHPFALSGGQCQRVAIALGTCNQPRLLIADEPTSALDVTIQAQILELLKVMKRRHNLAILLISHDLALVAEFADRIAVMYHGRLVEVGTSSEIFPRPRHPYTRALLESLPGLDHRKDRHPLQSIRGAPPSSGQELPGCAFAPRCPLVEMECTQILPPELALSESHWAACIKAK